MTGPRVPQSKPTSPDRTQFGGYLAVVAATALWGTSGVFVKFIADSSAMSALALAFWRDLLTASALWIGLGLLRPAWLRVRRRDLPWLIGLGSISIGLFHVLWNLGVLLSGVAICTVQQAAMPAVVAIGARLLWHEPLTWRKILAILLTFAGTLFVSGLDVLGRANLTLPGLLLGLGIPLTYATFSLFGKPLASRYHPPTVLTYGFTIATVTLLPFQFFAPQPWSAVGAVGPHFTALVFLSTIVPFSLYTFALGRLPASVAGILAMVEIPFASLYAYLLLGERLTPTQWLGAVLVVGGVLLLTWRRRTTPT